MAKVRIYTTATCGFCKLAKEFFREKDVEFEEKDVTDDEEARNEAIEKSGQMGVPVIDIDGEIVVGFDQDRVSQLLNL
ncbi:glutathione S-transferase N-terminal domain-containing protein [Patescibacteria group bacterium]|nr:glutathione S-transferase N-terminal domain-containing protein [Patescibacteria group bacterium]